MTKTTYGKGRLEAFSDGIFAIAITLLVLDIAVPENSAVPLWKSVLAQWPSYLGYLVSFATIGAIWLGHNAITDYLEKADPWLLRLNLALLLAVAFLPFPTRLMAESIEHESDGRVASSIYGITLLACMLLLSAVWQYALRSHLIRTDSEQEEIRELTRKVTPGIGGYVAMIVLGIFFPVFAVFGYLVVSVYLLFPFGAARRSAAGQ